MQAALRSRGEHDKESAAERRKRELGQHIIDALTHHFGKDGAMYDRHRDAQNAKWTVLTCITLPGIEGTPLVGHIASMCSTNPSRVLAAIKATTVKQKIYRAPIVYVIALPACTFSILQCQF